MDFHERSVALHRKEFNESHSSIKGFVGKLSVRKESEETPERTDSENETEVHTYKEITIDK